MLKSILTSDVSITVHVSKSGNNFNVSVPAFYLNAKINRFLIRFSSNSESRQIRELVERGLVGCQRIITQPGYVRYALVINVADHHQSSAKFIIST